MNDVVVIGGGPAGMMAAGRAAECGHSVLLLEKISLLAKTPSYRRRAVQSFQ